MGWGGGESRRSLEQRQATLAVVVCWALRRASRTDGVRSLAGGEHGARAATPHGRLDGGSPRVRRGRGRAAALLAWAYLLIAALSRLVEQIFYYIPTSDSAPRLPPRVRRDSSHL